MRNGTDPTVHGTSKWLIGHNICTVTPASKGIPRDLNIPLILDW